MTEDVTLVGSELYVPGRVNVDSFELRAGQCVVICGPNGSGKSSLLRVLGALLTPERGQVRLSGIPLQSMSRLEVAAKVAWLPQRPDLSEPMTCEKLVATARYRFFESEELALERAREFLTNQGLSALIGRLSHQVSGGELQRVLITSLIAQESPLLLVDEPANHLDPTHQVSTYRRLGELWRAGKGVVIVSHDVRLAQMLGAPDEVVVLGMKDGRVAMRTALSDPQLPSLLSSVYDVPFLSMSEAGSLAVDLRQVARSSNVPSSSDAASFSDVPSSSDAAREERS